MSSNFEECIEHVLAQEGGFVIHPHDTGGATNFGITKSVLSQYVNKPVSDIDVYNLNKDDAKKIYEKLYWQAMKLERIIYKNVQLILLDNGVNRGPQTAMKSLQKVLNTSFGAQLKVDGLFGVKTDMAISSVEEEPLCRKLIQDMIRSYVEIVLKHPTQKAFLKGWIERAFKLQDAISLGGTT